MINEVIPYIELDMVSYSSYDTQKDPENFRAALQYMMQQHNRTKASPEGASAIFVAEFGMGENTAPNSTIVETIENVVNEALAFGCPYVMYWETLGNEYVRMLVPCLTGVQMHWGRRLLCRSVS